MSAGEIAKRRRPLLDQVGLSQWTKVPLRKYSKGMLQRLGIADHGDDAVTLADHADELDSIRQGLRA